MLHHQHGVEEPVVLEQPDPRVHPQEERGRITSYNVCYTKLLRLQRCGGALCRIDGEAVLRQADAHQPQQLGAVLPAYARFAAAGTVFLGIAAGKPISAYETLLGGRPAVVMTKAEPVDVTALGQTADIPASYNFV